MPKPAMPCSVRGVLKTRSLPNSSARPWGRQLGVRWAMKEGVYHRATEDTTECNVFAKDDGGVVFHQGNATSHSLGMALVTKDKYTPHCVPNGLVQIHLPGFATTDDGSCGCGLVLICPFYTWCSQG